MSALSEILLMLVRNILIIICIIILAAFSIFLLAFINAWLFYDYVRETILRVKQRI